MTPTTRAAIELFRELDRNDRLAPELHRLMHVLQREGFPPALVHIACGTVCAGRTGLEVAEKLMRLGARMRMLEDVPSTDDELLSFLERDLGDER